MNNQKKTFSHKRVLALCAALLIFAVLAVSAYAADLGGIQATLKTWFRGKEATVEVTEIGENGEYEFAIKDENGETAATFGGGGVAMEPGGKERPLTPEEVLEGNELDLVREDNGRMMLYFRDRSYDITDLFNGKGVCKVKLKDENKKLFKTLYIDIKLEGNADDPFAGYGFSTSSIPHGAGYTALDG